MEMKPLQPLSHGSILIVGAKSSNFSDELKNHPRVTIWDNQQEHWTNKDLPANVRVVFVTRFIGHMAFSKIISEARKRQLTIFNPEGTGIITRQVKELLLLNKETVVTTINESMNTHATESKTEVKTDDKRGKLLALIPFIDLNVTEGKNAEILMMKAVELGITTTMSSLKNLVGRYRRNQGAPRKSTNVGKVKSKSSVKSLDASIEIFDDIITNLKDMREFLISTTRENQELKSKLNKFKKMIAD